MIDAAGLRVMKAIAEEGSFTGAAVALGYSQPAVSQMVRRLEQRTGTVLVERIGRNVRLTEAGKVLARHAVGVLSALDAAEEEVAAIAGLRAGRVRLMAFPSSSASLVPRALALVKERFPDISVTFSEGEPPESLAALRAGECDIAVAFAYAGHAVTMIDVKTRSVEQFSKLEAEALGEIGKTLASLSRFGLLAEDDANTVIARVSVVPLQDMAAVLAGAGLVCNCPVAIAATAASTTASAAQINCANVASPSELACPRIAARTPTARAAFCARPTTGRAAAASPPIPVNPLGMPAGVMRTARP